MDLSSIEQIIRTRVPNAPDSDVELYLDSVERDMKFGGDYSDMSEDDIVEDFEFYIQSRMDEAQKPSMKMKKSELKEMIKAAFLAEVDFTNAQDDDAALAGMYDPTVDEVEVNLPKINLPAISSKIEDSPKIDVIASKVQNNPKAMDALNKLASMYGLNKMNELDSSDFRSIEMAAKEFASTLQEMNDNDDASLTASGILGGPLLLMIPGVMDFIQQVVTSLQANPEYVVGTDSLIFLGSVVAGVAIGNILDRIKNNLEEGEDIYEEDLDEMLARLSEEEVINEQEEEEEEVDIDVKDTDLSSDDEEVESANDSIVVDKKIVSLSSLPQETRKILDTLETLRAQAEEFGDQKFITQVGNTITFFTRDFVVAGDQPNPAGIEESVTFPLWKKLNG